MKTITTLFCAVILFGLILPAGNASAYNLIISNAVIADSGKAAAAVRVVDDNGLAIDNLKPEDFIITEGDSVHNALSLDCPKSDTLNNISAVLTMDISGSMQDDNRIEIAKSAARAWIEGLFAIKSPSECAITAFSESSEIISHFIDNQHIQNKYILNSRLTGLYPQTNTNYDAALNWDETGGLSLLSRGRYSKILIFLTDGFPSYDFDYNKVLRTAKQNNISIYCVTLGMETPQFLRQMSLATGGEYFPNVTSIAEAVRVYKKILSISMSKAPCSLKWKPASKCGQIRIDIPHLALQKFINYQINSDSLPSLSFNSYVQFGAVKKSLVKDTLLNIVALNDTIKLSGVKLNSTAFKVLNDTTEFTTPKDSLNYRVLAPGDTFALRLRYTPEENISAATLEILSDACIGRFISINGGEVHDTPAQPEVRDGMFTASILTEVHSLDNLNFSGYNAGLGLQIYLLDRLAIRLSYGQANNESSHKLTDISESYEKARSYCGMLRYNLGKRLNVVGYLSALYKYSRTESSTTYIDGYHAGSNGTAQSAGLSLGAEWFPWHHFGVGLEYFAGATIYKANKVSGFGKTKEIPTFDNSSALLNSKINLIISYYIN